MTEVIGVRFKKVGKVYYFDPCGIQVKNEMPVIVETARGLEYGEVAMANTQVEDSKIVQPLKKLVRPATEADKKTMEQNLQFEKDAFRIGEERIAKHKLDMKLVSVEYTFDRSKILFYFSADGRVDFRELVKDLAGVFRTRIELRQIGVRDEARMIGGLGICGRPLCCSSFLDSFQPVSINMAKDQGLSLNPTKISGTCGRLMCCLKYEQNAYEDAAKRMPKVESFVQTPDGPGNVKSVDLLRETVKVSLDSAAPNEPMKCYHNCEVCVLRNGKGSRDGIEIPERPARYVEEKEEEELFSSPILSTPFYMDSQLEDAPVREKIGTPESSEGGKSRRRHRGGRRRGKSGQSKPEQTAPEKTEKKQPEKGEKKEQAKEGGKQPRQPKPQQKQKPQPKPAVKGGEQAAAGEGGEGTKRRRPRHRGGRRRNKGGGGGEGAAPKAE